MSVTIREVARQAGVSVATVSRVLNASGPVSDEKRARIEKVAAELRYVPNGAARSLITNQTQTLGVILPDLYGEFFSEVIRGIDEAVRAQQYHLLVSSSHSDRNELHAALRSMSGRVDGLIVMSPHVDARELQHGLPEGVPVVLLGSAKGDVPVRGHVTMDNFGGAQQVTEHLIALGHRRIVHLAGPEENADAQARQAGFRAALEAAGLPTGDGCVVTGDFTEAGGASAALRAVEVPEPPTALVAANDSMAIGAILALRERGIRVPEEVAVTGFDDLPIGRYLTPALTTVHVAIGALGARATALLFSALEASGDGFEAPDPEIIPAQLVVRVSCGAQH